jgi:hypothetical protein
MSFTAADHAPETKPACKESRSARWGPYALGVNHELDAVMRSRGSSDDDPDIRNVEQQPEHSADIPVHAQ